MWCGGADGGRFTKYDKEGEPIWLSYVRDGTRSGALYWCGLGEDPKASRAQERAVPLHAIVDVYFGKQTIQFTVCRVLVAVCLFFFVGA